MKYLLKTLGLLFISSFVLLLACEKDKPVEKTGKSVTIDSRAYDKWVYFSFSKDQVVDIEDFSNSYDWDIAFHRFDVRLNCGTSGPGQGGAYNAGQVDFESIAEAPESGYSLNDSISIIEESGVWEYTNVPGDTIISSWLTFSGPPPAYNINNNIYVIKTADGKYAKIWLKDYYNDDSQTGYVTMEYFYQPDGSRKLKE